jgi:hypothetical protein
MRVKIHLFSVCPFGLHGVLGQIGDVEGRKNRNFYWAERIEGQIWQKIQEIRFGREHTGSGIAENTEDRHFRKDRQSQNPKRRA